MTDNPKQPFDRSPKRFVFDTEDDRPDTARPHPFPDKGELFPPPSGDILDSDFEIFPEDSAQAERERLIEIARLYLPPHDQISDALFRVSSFDIINLMTAATIEDEFRGRLDDDAVDRLTAAAIIVGTEDASDILDFFPNETAALVMEFLDALDAETVKKRQDRIARFSPDAKRLFLAGITADLEISRRNLEEGTDTPPRKPQMDAMASLIAQTSALEGMDASLLRRAALSYNKLAHELGITRRLQQNKDGTVYLDRGMDGKPRPPRP